MVRADNMKKISRMELPVGSLWTWHHGHDDHASMIEMCTVLGPPDDDHPEYVDVLRVEISPESGQLARESRRASYFDGECWKRLA